MDQSLQVSSVHGILQVRILVWVAMPSSSGFSNPGINPKSPAFQADSLPSELAKSLQSRPTLCDPIDGSPPGSPLPGIFQARTGVGCHFLLQCMKVKSESEFTQSCLTLRDPMDCSPPGSSTHGIFQARVLEWGAIAFSVHEKNLNVHHQMNG